VKSFSARATAAAILRRVLEGESLNHLLPGALGDAPEAQRPLCRELIYGTLREWPYLEALCLGYLTKPLRNKDGDIKALLCAGLYELSHLSTPAHAALSETVEAARHLQKPWATGLINGVLRNYQRTRQHDLSETTSPEQQGIQANPTKAAPSASLSPAQRRALPEWLHRAFHLTYGDHIESIAQASRSRPPMALRVNRARILREEYLQLLEDQGVAASAHAALPDAVLLEQGVDVRQLPGFTEGLVSVQDCAAQHVADIIAPQPDERILDACAAPGGKACHLLERQSRLLALVASDVSENRLARLEENRARLGLTMDLQVADAAHPPPEWLATPFDAIVADVPCSATGVLRRNPDVKLLRRESDVEGFQQQQLAILEGLWHALKPGGRLLYVTCSLLDEENDSVVSAFCEQRDVDVEPVQLAIGIRRQFGWQTLPRVDDGDGLYFSLLRKPGL